MRTHAVQLENLPLLTMPYFSGSGTVYDKETVQWAVIMAAHRKGDESAFRVAAYSVGIHPRIARGMVNRWPLLRVRRQKQINRCIAAISSEAQ